MDTFLADDRGSSPLVSREARRVRFPMSTASVRLHRVEPWTVLEVSGEMDVSLASLLPELPSADARSVVFDLSGVTFMDAAALGCLIGRRNHARRLGGEVRLAAPSPPVRTILRLTGTSQSFPTFGSLHEAVSGGAVPTPDTNDRTRRPRTSVGGDQDLEPEEVQEH